MLFDEPIYPYSGITSIKLYQSISEVSTILSAERIPFRAELWSGESETVPNPWNVLVVDHVMSLFFARNGKLFKIVFWDNYTGCLPNSICTGMGIDAAQKLDLSLKYDEWNEDYESASGYWLEDNPENGKVSSISIFIKEILDEEHFDYCNW